MSTLFRHLQHIKQSQARCDNRQADALLAEETQGDLAEGIPELENLPTKEK